jgi:hypothetical protein
VVLGAAVCHFPADLPSVVRLSARGVAVIIAGSILMVRPSRPASVGRAVEGSFTYVRGCRGEGGSAGTAGGSNDPSPESGSKRRTH